MKRLTSVAVVAALIAVVALVPSFAASAIDGTGSAKLHQIETSGIRAAIGFLDTGTELVVDGSARGLDPGQAYISLVYDNGSVPSGPDACAPSDENDLSFPQMVVGAWQVDSDGNGTLTSVKRGPTYVPLEQIGAMSVRIAATRLLQACGKVVRP